MIELIKSSKKHRIYNLIKIVQLESLKIYLLCLKYVLSFPMKSKGNSKESRKKALNNIEVRSVNPLMTHVSFALIILHFNKQLINQDH